MFFKHTGYIIRVQKGTTQKGLVKVLRTLEKFKETLYEMQTDLSIMIDDEQEALDRVPKDSEEAEIGWNIIFSLRDTTEALEEAMDHLQAAIDESEDEE